MNRSKRKKIKVLRLKKEVYYKILIIISSFIVLLFFINMYKKVTAKVEVVLQKKLKVEVYSKVKASHFIKSINGKITNDFYVSTKKIGKKQVKIDFVNDNNINVSYTFNIKVVDKTAPVIWLNNSYSIEKDSKDTLLDDIISGDNYDSKPKRKIVGEYDLKVPGNYSLTYKVEDKSGNKTEKKFTLNVYEKTVMAGSSKNTGSTTTSKLKGNNYEDVVKDYKTKNTKVGIDLSKWQGNVDFKKLKASGVEFVILRVGISKGVDGAYILDEKFKRNIKNANKYKIPVGVYFYSYADSKEKAQKDAKWVIKQIKDYKISLPVAYDFEDWESFNSYNVSFYELTDIAKSFMNTIEKSGYKTMLYSSKVYLETFWMNEDEYDVWLAHYTDKTTYDKEYKFWQICENGIVDGIDSYVDIDIMNK